MVHGLSLQSIRLRGFTGKVFRNKDLVARKRSQKTHPLSHTTRKKDGAPRPNLPLWAIERPWLKSRAQLNGGWFWILSKGYWSQLDDLAVEIGGGGDLNLRGMGRTASGDDSVRRYTISYFWLEFSVDVLAPAISSSSFTTRFSVGAFLIAALSAWALVPQSGDLASVHGTVRDAQGRAVSQAQVQLQGKDSKDVLSATTDAQGLYRISNLQHGTYVLRAVGGSGTAEISSLALGPNESKTVDVVLGSAASSAQTTPQFHDEPQFTVSGVTDTTNLGGHGSDTVVRTRESLAKETAALTQPTAKGAGANASATEKSLRSELDHTPGSFEANYRLGLLLLENNKAEEGMQFLRHAAEIQPGNALVHHALGDAGEKAGDPLAAVREYQRAAEIDPSEPFLFDWGSELLLHHAPEPAIEVFSKGNSRYPKSARMLIGLGAAAFARGANEQAVQRMCEASDLNPVDPTPYRFLGKMLRAGNRPSQDEIDKLQRFVKLQPQNAEANYYYAVALWKSRKDPNDPAVSRKRNRCWRAQFS